MKKTAAIFLSLIFCVAHIIPVFADDNDYSYLEDMTVKELRELRDAINELLGDDEKQKKETPTDSSAQVSDNLEENELITSNETKLPEDDLDLGGWNYHYVSHEIELNQYTGKMDVRIFFDCTNNSSYANSVFMSIKADAYQNGIQINTPSRYDTKKDEYNYRTGPSIQPGKTVRAVFVFQLEDLDEDVTFELSNYGFFSKPKLRKVL